MSYTYVDPTDPATIDTVRHYWAVEPIDRSRLIVMREKRQRAIDAPFDDLERVRRGLYELEVRCINERLEAMEAENTDGRV